ncbi:MAG: TonB-dependent receptor plug domain-containing protein, partial [Opitutales bacterium]
MIRALLPLALPLAFALGQEKELAPLEVQGSTIPSAKEKLTVFDQSRLAQSPKLHLDQILRENPAFGTYRRSNSSIAHPTAQGVSLRGTGTSAASRSIILLDGIPLNDPFGGWVRWNRFSLGELKSVRFGQTSAFASSAGTIELTTRGPVNDPIRELRLAT